MAMVVINISSVLTDVGFSNALIQQKTTKNITFSSVFYVNLSISLLLSLIIIGISPFVAHFFEDPKLQNIMYFLAVIPPISAAGSVQSAILIKKIDFKRLTIRDIIATVVGGVLGVIAALSDFGVYSLVIQQLTMVFLGTALLWYATKWKPKWEFSSVEIKKLFSFSSYVFLDVLIRRIFLNIDTIFIGKVFSPLILGVYARAQSLKSQVDSYSTQSLSKIIFPVLSQVQDDEKSFKATYHKAFNTISGIMVLLIAPLYFLADDIIINLLGEQWQRSVLLFEILVLAAIVRPLVSIMGSALLAKGYSKFKFKVGLIQRVLMLFPISIGYFYGISEFTAATVITFYIVFLLYLLAMDKKMNIKFWIQLKNAIIPNLLFLIFIILDYTTGINIYRWLIVVLFIVLQLVFLKIIKHESFNFIYANIRSLLRKSKKNKF
jgi:O-antigen/teichoic acid export membrane protein